MDLSNSAYIYIYIYMHGNMYNNIMRNSLQASRSLYILYRHVFSLPNCQTQNKAFLEKYTISAGNVAFWSVVCCSLSKHSVKIIDESTFLVRLHYVLTCFLWKVAWPSHNHTNSCTVMQKFVKSDLSQLHPPHAYLLCSLSTINPCMDSTTGEKHHG